MAFTVILDACVLYSAPTRDLLIRVAQTGLFRARWTDAILDECFGSILRNRSDLRPEDLQRTRELMNQAIPDVLVQNHERLADGLLLPDPNDRHVVAAAIGCGAQVIVTSNLKDFPEEALAPHRIEAQSPDEFVVHLIDLNARAVLEATRRQAASLKRPPMSLEELLKIFEGVGLPKAAVELRKLGDES